MLVGVYFPSVFFPSVFFQCIFFQCIFFQSLCFQSVFTKSIFAKCTRLTHLLIKLIHKINKLTFYLAECSVQHVGLVYCKNHSKLLENVHPHLNLFLIWLYHRDTLRRLILQVKFTTKHVMMDENMSKKTKMSKLKTALPKSSIFCHWK